jgi:hypothetical protein
MQKFHLAPFPLRCANLKKNAIEFFSNNIKNQVNSLGNGTSWEKYDAWRIGDTKLDWYGAQKGQGTYMGTSASGTPMALTTNVKGKPEYQELNKYSYNRGQK